MIRLRVTMLCIFMSAVVSEISIAEQTINTSSIQEARRLSLEKKIPIMLIFFDDDCDNCIAVNEEFLKPMIISGDYEDKVVMFYVDAELGEINGFADKVVEMEVFVAHYNIELFPTVSIVDANGNELSESVSGVSNLEYYGSSLDEAIESALIKLK